MKLLIANRGEIAVRIIRTCKEMNISSVVGYCDLERDAKYVKLADEAYRIGANASAFMDGQAFIAIAQRAAATAVHPGYGFLSESPEFAQAVREAGLIWVGPEPNVLRALGDKASARSVAASVGVKTVPGCESEVLGEADVRAFIEKAGYPVVMKKVDGGGGRGISILRDSKQVAEYFQVNGAEVTGVIVEKFLEAARHIETQCVRDSHGNFAVVSTRDCSLQRRNQKLIEEAPAFNLPERIARQIIDDSAKLFEKVGFVGAGTCEFLFENDLYFLEVNPRLQVEHTVSEEVTGVDLVRTQLEIASGQALTEIPQPRGHSIELRITSEDPAVNMMPTAGVITDLAWPLGNGVRIDTALCEGDAVTTEFDSMIAKIIVTAPSRSAAIARAKRALAEFEISGVATPAPLYRAILEREEFVAGEFSTRWLEEKFLPEWNEAQKMQDLASASANAGTGGEAMAQGGVALARKAEENHTFTIEIDGKRGTLTVPRELISAQRRHTLPAQPLRRSKRIAQETVSDSSDGTVNSPIQALVLKVCTSPGAQVKEGDLLVVLESMKMESYVYAPCDGEVVQVAVSDGDNVTPGALLARIEEQG